MGILIKSKPALLTFANICFVDFTPHHGEYELLFEVMLEVSRSLPRFQPAERLSLKYFFALSVLFTEDETVAEALEFFTAVIVAPPAHTERPLFFTRVAFSSESVYTVVCVPDLREAPLFRAVALADHVPPESAVPDVPFVESNRTALEGADVWKSPFPATVVTVIVSPDFTLAKFTLSKVTISVNSLVSRVSPEGEDSHEGRQSMAAAKTAQAAAVFLSILFILKV